MLQSISFMVESTGIEPVTSCLQGRRSPSWANPPYRDLPFLKWWAKMDSLSCGKATAVTTCRRHVVKSRLSSPFWLSLLQNSIVSVLTTISVFLEVVGQNGLEPSTSRLSVVCSSQLSYWPISASLLFKVHSLLYPLNWITHSCHLHYLVLTLGRYK